MNRKLLALLRVVFAAVLAVSAAFAQRDLATLVGTISDASGSAVPNAKITITEEATGLKYELVSGASGEYARPALKPAVYSMTVEAAGFKKTTRRNIPLTAGDRTGIDI